MCLIINREQGQAITEDFIRNVAVRNRDGWGFMYNSPKTKQVVVKKGLVLADFFEHFNPVQEKDIPSVIHFRMKTHGEISTDNCHPFEVVQGVQFMHNGTIDVDIPKKDATKMSDTAVFVRDVLRPMLLSIKDRTSAMRSSWFEHFMAGHAAAENSRYVLMDHEGPMFFGNWTKTTKGVWCSNTYAYSLDNPTYKPPVVYTPPKRHNTGYYGAEYGYAGDDYSSVDTTKPKFDLEPFKRKANETDAGYIERIKQLTLNDADKKPIQGESIEEYQKRIGILAKETTSRAAGTASVVNANFGTRNYSKLTGESALSYYRRLDITKDSHRYKLPGEEPEEFQARMRGDFDSLIALPYYLEPEIKQEMALEYGANLLEVDREIRSDRHLAAAYLERLEELNKQRSTNVFEKKEADKSATPFHHQNTQDEKQLGSQKEQSTTQTSANSQGSSGNDSTKTLGTKQGESSTNARQDDPFADEEAIHCSALFADLEDEEFLKGIRRFPTVMSNEDWNKYVGSAHPDETVEEFEQRQASYLKTTPFKEFIEGFTEGEEGEILSDDEQAIALLEERLEEELEQFETVAEDDWCLDQETIEQLSNQIVTGEVIFKYDANGMSTLSNTMGVIHPVHLASKTN